MHSHKWKIQSISDGIFILLPESCPRGGTLGRWGAQGVIKSLFLTMVMWQIKWKGITSKTECKKNYHPRVKLVTLGWTQKVKYHLISIQSQFQRVLCQTLSVFSQMKDTKHIRQDFIVLCFIVLHGSYPRGGTFGHRGHFFSNIFMWHIKSTVMTSRTGCKKNFYPRDKLVTLGWGQKVKYH